MIRLLIVDDQRLVRSGLRMLCAPADDLEVVAEAGNGQEATRLAARLRPDVVLMDLHMPGIDGAEATRRILAERPTTKVVVLTTFDDDDHLYPAPTAGACGFLAKDVAPEELLDAIRRAAAGNSLGSPATLRRVVARAVAAETTPDPQAPTEGTRLTRREIEVLTLVGHGLSNPEIADRLHVGVTTVKSHLATMMGKTGTNNRVRLAVLAARMGLLTE
ncbi:response regulator [Embleya sp. NPDC050154]|uniref:response regulator n=1 Tax=Embleya sp. NPDC050154 TaxID=3363988 RepID=UPI00379BDC6D